MAYVAIDPVRARVLGQVLLEASTRTDALRRDVIGALTLADLASHMPAQLGTVQDGLTTLGTGVIEKAGTAEEYVVDPQGIAAHLGAPMGPAPTVIAEALAGFSVSEPRSTLAASPENFSGKVVNIVVVGDSFASGEGAGEGRYIEMGSTTGGTSLAHPAHQSPDAPSLRAIEALQGQYPEATIRVTYSANPSRVQTIPPLIPGGDGPLFDVKFVAESGATARSAMVSGMNSLLPAQIAAVNKDTDILIYSLGGNDVQFSSAVQSAVFRMWFGNGVEDINALADAAPTHTMDVVDALVAMVKDKNPDLQVIGVGYPNILTSLDVFGRLLPVVPTGRITDNIDPFENVALWNFGEQVDVLGKEAAQLVQEHLVPGQSLTFLPYWGTWGAGQTMYAGWNGTVPFNYWGERFQESFHPSPDTYPNGVERAPFLDLAAMAQLTDLQPGGQAFMAGPLLPALSGAVAKSLGQAVVDPADPFATLGVGLAGFEPPSDTPVVTEEMAQDPYGFMADGIAVSLPEANFDPFAAFGPADWLPPDPGAWDVPDLGGGFVLDSPGLSYTFDDVMEPYPDFGYTDSLSVPEFDPFEAFSSTPSYSDDSFSFDF